MNLAKLRPILKNTRLISTMGLILVGALTSCGYDKSSGEKEESLYFSEAALTGGAPLDDAQMAVALRVCYAFRTKRSKFLVEMLGDNFNFSHTATTCDGSSTQSSFSAQLVQDNSTDPLKYESDFSGSYIREVQTDLNGYLSNLCGNVLAGETPLNTTQINNELYEYRFQSSTSAGDRISITIGSNQTIGASTPTVTQKLVFNILTNATSSGNYQGMVIEATRYLPCAGGDTNLSRYYKQVFQAP